MEINFRLFFGVLFVVNFINFTTVNSFFMQCPYYQLRFQKIIGFRPVGKYSHQLNRNNDESHRNIETMNINCLKICQMDEMCSSYVYLLDKNECYGFTKFSGSTNYGELRNDDNENDNGLVPDVNAIYFEKTCLNVPENCKNKLWSITKIPGSSLIFQGKKMISSLITKRECAERCIFEKEFKCLSASFTPSYKNNIARFNQLFRNREIIGRCVLSDKDKNIQPEAYKSGLRDEEYIENHCSERLIEDISCSYELFSNSSFLLPELRYFGLTQRECQLNCSKEQQFYCQGASYIEEKDSKHSECYLHSEDLISIGPRSLQIKNNSLYLRRVKCLNVSVECNNEEMIIKYSPNDWFRGKIYVSSHSEDCSVIGSGTSLTELRLRIGDERVESKCGIIRAYEVTKTSTRTFISTLIMVQNNPNVQTQGDRVIKVGCIITSQERIDDKIPNALALESNWNLNETDLMNQENISINSTSSDDLNRITFLVIDLDKNSPTKNVEIGQNLELRITQVSTDGRYDIRVTSLVAKSNGQSYQLIDKNGCPTDPSIFPKFEKFVVNDMKILRGKFNAFKFTGKSLVNFNGIIKVCLDKCPEPDCENVADKEIKRQRRNNNDAVRVKNTLYVTSINNNNHMIEGNGTEIIGYQVPLDLNINVREPIWNDNDELTLGNNGLRITADDVTQQEEYNNIVCMNQSLLIALLIFAAILQIILLFTCFFIILRYKKIASYNDDKNSLHTIHENLSYIDRRVRWADNSGFAF